MFHALRAFSPRARFTSISLPLIQNNLEPTNKSSKYTSEANVKEILRVSFLPHGTISGAHAHCKLFCFMEKHFPKNRNNRFFASKYEFMRRGAGIFLLFLGSILVIASCARRGTPEGGPKDLDPPRYVSASPSNYSINFDGEEIRINFNEYVRLEQAQTQIVISPPMEIPPEITPMGAPNRQVRIKLNDTLLPNTTYAINFGRSIVDNNEGNVLNFFRYVFSTGDYLDSLEVSGAIKDAYQATPDPFISVMLYEIDSAYSDSAVYNRTPRYITNTLDSAITFQLENLKEGQYQMVAIQDLNNNYKFDPATEKIGFLNQPVTIPTDSLYLLNLFQEELEFAPIRPGLQGQQHIIIGHQGVPDPERLAIQLLPPVPDNFETRLTKDRETDTLHLWYKPQLERDSLVFLLDSYEYVDTLMVRNRPAQKDSLTFSFDPSGTLELNQEFKILPTIPLQEVDSSLISLVDRDTLPVPFELTYDAFRNEVIVDFAKNQEQRYTIEALPGAFTDFFGTTNDTLTTQYTTRALSDYGTITMEIENIQSFPVIVQLTDEDYHVLDEIYSEGQSSFTFEYIRPGNYHVRLIYDNNGNGKWDSGNFLERIQPEEIIYFPEMIDVRANWEVTHTFILDSP